VGSLRLSAGNSHKRLEVGLIGSEGMTGLPIVLGNDRSPHENFIQVAGEGSRIRADKLREAIRQAGRSRRRFLKFAHSFMNQTAIPPSPMARPLLRSAWRAGCSWPMTVWMGTRYRLLHEFLSLMLGVRRAGVTVALNYLESRGIIRLSRGQIVITDRKGLKASANGTYHEPEDS